MKNGQFTIDEVLAVLRRRRLAFLLPAVLIITLCGLGAFLLPKQYESSTTILVQSDAVLNPLVTYSMGIALQSADRLGDFDEIIYSRPTIESLMDSLGLQRYLTNRVLKDQAIAQITKNIKTSRNGSDSYTISYLDTIPARAQKAARVLSELFIQTRLSVENRKNEFAVGFFQQKAVQLRDKFEKSQKALVASLQQHIDQLPEGDRVLYSDISDYSDKIRTLEQQMKNYHEALGILDSASKTGADQHIDPSRLSLIPLLGVPYASDLQDALTKYNQISQEYTERYPEVQVARAKLLQQMILVEGAIRGQEDRLQSQILSLEERRNKAITSVQEATAAQSQDEDLKSNFNIYQTLYNQMKVKLEQAETNRQLGQYSGREYVVINPPQLPVKPAKPNKALIMGGGLGLGVFLGLLCAGLVELFDTRIRTPQDIEIFEKPIIAYLPAPGSRHDD